MLQGVASNYDTDLFQPILARRGRRWPASATAPTPADDVSLRVIADHLRAVAFLLADGVIPGNEGRGYVLRRILRRAVRHGMRLGFEEPFLHRLLPVLGEVDGPSLPRARGDARGVGGDGAGRGGEVPRHRRQRLAAGAGGDRGGARARAATQLAGADGVPALRHLRPAARGDPRDRRGGEFTLDEAGFEASSSSSASVSRSATEGVQRQAAQPARGDRAATPSLPATRFVGYDRLQLEGARGAAACAREDGRASSAVALAAPPARTASVVLDRPSFYAEAGGQVGDAGR